MAVTGIFGIIIALIGLLPIGNADKPLGCSINSSLIQGLYICGDVSFPSSDVAARETAIALTLTKIAEIPSATPTVTLTLTETVLPTSTATFTPVPTLTSTSTPFPTHTFTPSLTPTPIATFTPVPTLTSTSTPFPAPTLIPSLPLTLISTPSFTGTLPLVETATPIGMVSEVHRVDGASSAGWGQAEEDSWYATDIYIKEGDAVSIQYVSGEWWIGKVENNEWVPQFPTTGDGYTGRNGEQVIAQMRADEPSLCLELKSAPIASLIGRIGDQGGVFLVGNSKDFEAQESGILFLRINYNCRSGYAFNGLGDCPVLSGGKLSIRITVVP